MAYKRISPLPIIEGGTNTKSLTTTDGVVYYDGTKLATTNVGNSGDVLLSQGGAGNPPMFGPTTAGGNVVMTLYGRNLSNNQQLSLFGDGSFYYLGSTFSDVGMIMPVAGTIKLLTVYCPTNPSGADNIITLVVNGSTTALTTTIPASTTGTFIDSTHSVSVNAGDQVGYVSQNSLGSFVNYWSASVSFA